MSLEYILALISASFTWLTEEIYPSVALFIFSVIVTVASHQEIQTYPHDVLAQTAPILHNIFIGFAKLLWWFTGLIFFSCIVRKALNRE